jgi:hypothetical protein
MDALVPLAALYVAAIHDDGPTGARNVLDALYAIPAPPGVDPDWALATILAAMVDPDRTVTAQLAWTRSVAVYDDNPTGHIPPVNPFAVELALSGWMKAHQLTDDHARAAATELAIHRGWTRDQIAHHLEADPADVHRWVNTARVRQLRKAQPA